VTEKTVENEYFSKEFSYRLRLLEFACQLPLDGRVKTCRKFASIDQKSLSE